MKPHRSFFNMYLTTTISIALVLCLVGLECIVLLSAHELLRHIRENVTLTIVMADGATSDETSRMGQLLTAAPYCHDYRYISREEALQEHIRNLGDDPEKFLGFNPLSDAYEVHMNATYAQSDSIAAIEARLTSLPYVDKIIYQEDVVKVLDSNVGEASLVLLAIAVALLVIALVLISNTIQLQVYSKRFLINTMRLVGATPWVIKWPFIRRNMRMGVEASVVALAALAGAFYYCKARLGILLFPLTWQNITFVVAVVLISGVAITFFASWVATNRYIRMKVNKMYEI